MPVYRYQCKDCNKEFEIKHAMSYDEQKCILCDSDNIFKVPSLSVEKVPNKPKGRPGKIVDKYLQDAKQEIKKEKETLRTREL